MRPIHVRSARLHPLFNHPDTTLRLPAEGVVLITGPNESGKTALLDAVSVGLFGESISGRPPWPGDRGAVTVETDRVAVNRTRKSRTNVVWRRHGEEPTPWESPSKASDALAAELGSHRVWASTSVFNRRTGAAFLGRNDADWKRLLEDVLDLAVLDAAHRRATTAHAAAAREASTVTAAAATARARATASQRASDSAGAAHPTQPPPNPAMYLAGRTRAEETVAALDAARAADAETAAELRRIDGALRALVATPTACPACRRPFDGVADAAEHLAAERTALASARVTALVAHRTTQTTLAEAARAARDAEGVLRGYDIEARAAEQAARFRAVREQLAATAKADADAADRAEALAVGPVHRHAVLTAAREVLGIGGVRGHLLASALPVLAASANGWLARMGRPDWRFRLATSSANADGEAVDKLTVALDGTPNGGGYAELSEGARHRANLAMAIALGELAGAQHAGEGGTWFFDEALDAPLDATGAADIAETLRDIARGAAGTPRCVVVIGHSPEIARVLRPDLHYECAAGALTLRRASEGRTG